MYLPSLLPILTLLSTPTTSLTISPSPLHRNLPHSPRGPHNLHHRTPSPSPALTPSRWGPGPPAWKKYHTSYAATVLAHHNLHRANHSSPPLAWSDALFRAAKVLAGRCEGVHDTSVSVSAEGDGERGEGYGQNFAWEGGRGWLGIGGVVNGLFYGGEAEMFEKAGLYGMPDIGELFEEVGHFTQVVWKATTHVGCVTHDCAAKWPDMRYFTVCNYSPPGNMVGDFAENVLPPGRSDARLLPPYPDPVPDGE